MKKSVSFTKVEFWAAITIFVFAVFFFITDGLKDISSVIPPNKELFDQAMFPFSFYRNYFVPQLVRNSFLFCAFLLLNFVVIPRVIKKEALVKNTSIVLLVFLLSGIILGTTDTYLKEYLFTNRQTYHTIFWNSFLYAFWLLFLLGLYSVVKYAGLYLISNAEAIHEKYRFITPDGIVAFVLWMISLFLLLISNVNNAEIMALWVIIGPSGILVYWYSFYVLIPHSLSKKRAFLVYSGKVILGLLITYLPVSLLILPLTNGEVAFNVSLFNVAFQLLITAPLSWLLFNRQIQGKQEVYLLRKELRQSHAHFDFLRSQINPHFLFNALNTIYGTAIQEKAERTSEAIELLGDMMRFMLQENMEEKISLAREIEYLNNYISLQRLRTDQTPGVKIQTQIESPVSTIQIAPMLLIPFIENAFKHGISLREPSHIIISLEMKDNHTLHFDVHNSKHVKPANDPEKNKSGIGLNNVKQRLQLFYPNRHELIIRETWKEYFVHLTIQLPTSQ